MIAWLPLVAVLLDGGRSAIPYAVGWGVIVTGYTVSRLIDRGYLPLAEPVAKALGLHDRIGPESRSHVDDESRDRE